VRTLWTIAGSLAEQGAALAVGTNVHVTGAFAEAIDVDPGAATVTRMGIGAFSDSGFSVGLDASGAYQTAHAFTRIPFGIAATPGGGSLVMIPTGTFGYSLELRAFNADGTSSWTLPLNPSMTEAKLVASSTHFIVHGIDDIGGDYDPGPGTDQVIGPVAFVTRYAF
jgi:hypothetical protein